MSLALGFNSSFIRHFLEGTRLDEELALKPSKRHEDGAWGCESLSFRHFNYAPALPNMGIAGAFSYR